MIHFDVFSYVAIISVPGFFHRCGILHCVSIKSSPFLFLW